MNQGLESLQRAGHERLYPSLTNPSYLALRMRRKIFSRWVAEIPGDQLCVLDVGGRHQPYRPLLEGRIARYVGLDIQQTELVDVIASGEALPFAKGSFDVVIATQVFDYFAEPGRAGEQILSVLKPGGVLLASFPACTPRCAEEERWRFTTTAIRSVLGGFRQIEVVPEIFSLGGMARTMNQALDTFVRYESLRYIYRRTICPLINIKGMALEALKLSTNDQFTTNYSVRAVR